MKKLAHPLQRLSPVSPFQFGSYGDLASPSASSSSSSFSSSLDQPDINFEASYSSLQTASLSDLLHIRQRLSSSMNEAHQLGRAIDKAASKLDSKFNGLPVLEHAAVSISSRLEQQSAIDTRVDAAMAPTLKLLGVFDRLHFLQDAIASGVDCDAGLLLENITRFENCLSFVRESCPRAIERLQQTIDFLSRTHMLDSFSMLKLKDMIKALKTLQMGHEHISLYEEFLDEAIQELESEFRRILTQYGAPLPPPNFNSLPSPLIQVLQEIAFSLHAHGRLKNCIQIYEDVRCRKAAQRLQILHRLDYLKYTTPDELDKLEWSVLESHISHWIQHIQILLEVILPCESRLCRQVFSLINPVPWGQCFGNLAMKAGLSSFMTFCEAVVKSKKEPHKLFKMLELFEVLQKVKADMERISAGSCQRISDELKELEKKTVLGACRVFWEFGVQVEVQGEGSIPSDGSVLRLASYVVNYIKYLISGVFKNTMSEVLKSAQIWRGEATDSRSSELQPAILDIMQSLERNIESRAKLCDDPALGNLFLLNNYRYIHVRSIESELGALMGDVWLKHYEKKIQHYALEYQKAAWGPVLLNLRGEGINLSSNNKLKASRELLRQRIEGFEQAMNSSYQRHRRWSIIDKELREQMGLAVKKSVVEAYRKYLNQYESLLHLGLTPFQLKCSPADIEQRLITLFDEELGKKESQGVNGMQIFHST